MMMSDKKVLVTGALGFTGRYVTDALAVAGYEVFGLGFEQRESFSENYAQVDLADFSQVLNAIDEIRPHVVIHLAAVAFVGHDNPDAFYKVNLMGTRNLLDALVRTNSGRDGVVLASSANIYGNAQSEKPISENTPPNPVNDYAVSKLAMEYMAKLWFERLPITIARPFNYTGIGQDEKFLIPKIVESFRRREKYIELGNLNVCRDFSDVRFVAQAYKKLLEIGAWGKIINVCSGKIYSIADILTICERVTKYKIEIRQNKDLMRSNEVSILLGDCSNFDRFIKIEKIKLEDTIEWMFSNGENEEGKE